MAAKDINQSFDANDSGLESMASQADGVRRPGRVSWSSSENSQAESHGRTSTGGDGDLDISADLNSMNSRLTPEDVKKELERELRLMRRDIGGLKSDTERLNDQLGELRNEVVKKNAEDHQALSEKFDSFQHVLVNTQLQMVEQFNTFGAELARRPPQPASGPGANISAQLREMTELFSNFQAQVNGRLDGMGNRITAMESQVHSHRGDTEAKLDSLQKETKEDNEVIQNDQRRVEHEVNKVKSTLKRVRSDIDEVKEQGKGTRMKFNHTNELTNQRLTGHDLSITKSANDIYDVQNQLKQTGENVANLKQGGAAMRRDLDAATGVGQANRNVILQQGVVLQTTVTAVDNMIKDQNAEMPGGLQQPEEVMAVEGGEEQMDEGDVRFTCT